MIAVKIVECICLAVIWGIEEYRAIKLLPKKDEMQRREQAKADSTIPWSRLDEISFLLRLYLPKIVRYMILIILILMGIWH